MVRRPISKQARRRLRRAGLAMVVAICGYFGAAAWAGSERLVNPPNRSAACRTPGSLGWEYEAINYERAADRALASEPDPWHCAHSGAQPGSLVVSSDGVPIAGWWIPAVDPIGPRGATVVLVHGFVDNKSGMLEYAAFLHRHFNLVLFDLRNSGQSGGTQTMQGTGEQRDLRAVLDWLVRTKHPEQIVVFGQSMGGAAAVNLAADDDRVDALILDSTHDRLRTPVVAGIATAGFPMGSFAFPLIATVGSLRTGENLWSAEPISAIVRLGQRPVLILHGSADRVDRLESAERMHAAAAAAGVAVEMHICEGAGHGALDETCPGEYGQWLNGFVERAVAAAAPESHGDVEVRGWANDGRRNSEARTPTGALGDRPGRGSGDRVLRLHGLGGLRADGSPAASEHGLPNPRRIGLGVRGDQLLAHRRRRAARRRGRPDRLLLRGCRPGRRGGQQRRDPDRRLVHTGGRRDRVRTGRRW